MSIDRSMARHSWVAYKTLAAKEIRRFARLWLQTVLPSAITMSLYFVIFGKLVGKRIGDMEGHNYMEFIVPGLIMMAVITNSYSNVVSSFYGAKFQRHVEEMLVSPMPNWCILCGFITGGTARGLTVAVVVTIVSLAFTSLKIHNTLITASVVVLTAVLFSLGGFINAIFARRFDDIAIVPTFVLTPLTYLGGVFYSISMLSPFWQGVSRTNPILYMVNAFRYGILGYSDIDLKVAFGVIIGFIAALYFFALYLLHRGVGVRS